MTVLTALLTAGGEERWLFVHDLSTDTLLSNIRLGRARDATDGSWCSGLVMSVVLDCLMSYTPWKMLDE